MSEIVIKIPKELYKSYKDKPPMLGDAGMDMIAQSIANGTPLPEHHGRLIILSEAKMKENLNVFDFSSQNWISEVNLSNATVAIIEAADKEVEE